MARLRGELRLLHIGADGLGDLRRERLDALHALALASELGMEGDGVELLRPVLKLHLAVLVPEEAGVREPCGDDLVVAGDDGLAAVLGDHVGDEQVAVGKRPVASRCGARSTSGGS